MRHAAWAEKHLTGLDDRGLLFAFGREINQVLHAAQLQRYFVAGIDVEVLSLSAAAVEKGERFGILLQDATSFALCFDALDDVFEINRNQIFHKASYGREYISFETHGATSFPLGAVRRG